MILNNKILTDTGYMPKMTSSFVRQKGLSEVYDVSDGLPRHIKYEEAVKKNIWKKIKDQDYLYSPYKGVNVSIKDSADKDYDNNFGKEGGYIKFGEPTNIYIRKGTPAEKIKAITAHELGHWFTRKWMRSDYIKNLGYADTNENDVITLNEKVANDYELYKLGLLKNKNLAKKFKQLEKQ